MQKIAKYWTKRWLNKNLWLLFFIGIFTLMLFSCSAPRGIKSTYRANNLPNNNQNVEKATEQVAMDEENGEQIIEADEYSSDYIEQNYINQNDNEQISQNKQVPTLNQMMRQYEEEQIAIKEDTQTMKGDIQDLKYSVDEVKRLLSAVSDGEQEYAVAGVPPANQTFASEKKNNNKSIILSDEEADYSKKTRQPAPTQKTMQAKAQTQKAKPKPTESKKQVVPTASSQQVLNSAPSSAAVQEKVDIQEAINLIKNKDFNQAISSLNSLAATEKDPSTLAGCNYWLGEAHFAIKEWDKSIQYYQQVLRSKDSQYKDNAQAMIAEIHCRVGKINEARQAFSELIEKYPSSQYIPRARRMLQQL